MTRDDTLNLFAVGRSLGFALTATGLIILLGYLVAASTLHGLPILTIAAMLGAAGLRLLFAGAVALIRSLAGLFVWRTRFRSD